MALEIQAARRLRSLMGSLRGCSGALSAPCFLSELSFLAKQAFSTYKNAAWLPSSQTRILRACQPQKEEASSHTQASNKILITITGGTHPYQGELLCSRGNVFKSAQPVHTWKVKMAWKLLLLCTSLSTKDQGGGGRGWRLEKNVPESKNWKLSQSISFPCYFLIVKNSKQMLFKV